MNVLGAIIKAMAKSQMEKAAGLVAEILENSAGKKELIAKTVLSLL